MYEVVVVYVKVLSEHRTEKSVKTEGTSLNDESFYVLLVVLFA